jgi:hypothetical protein
MDGCRGMLGTGCSCAVVRASTPMAVRVSEFLGLLVVDLPGRWCDVSVGMTEAGAHELVKAILEGLPLLREARAESRRALGDLPALEVLPGELGGEV